MPVHACVGIQRYMCLYFRFRVSARVQSRRIKGLNRDMKLLIATSNKGNLPNSGRLLSDMPLELVGLDAFGEVPAPEENGSTFEDNAVLKAATYGRELGIISLADDSGLEVEALNGKPGVHSARYGGENLTDAQRTAFLLENMRNVPMERETHDLKRSWPAAIQAET